MVGCKIKMNILGICYVVLICGKIGEERVKGNEKKETIRKRKAVNRLYFEEGFRTREIARIQEVSLGFVSKWTQSRDQDFEEDNRGWEKGKSRVWNKETKKRIAEIRKDLQEDEREFFLGATAVENEWRERYPGEESPPLRTIGKILKDLGLTGHHKKGKNKGAAKYLCYPEHTIYQQLGERVLEADFLGEKYIEGRTQPLNFLGYSFKKEPKIRYFKRVKGKRSEEFIKCTKGFFEEFETPDVVKVDNAAAYIGNIQKGRNISRVMAFLLKNKVKPVYTVPRRPFTQASIEGNNSVFSRKFWNKRKLESVQDVDKNLEWFNKASLKYTGYRPPDKTERTKEFEPEVYFTRQIREKQNTSEGEIRVLNEIIDLGSEYINYFVLAQWKLKEEKLLIRFEKDKSSKVIKKIEFPINERSKEKWSKQLNL